MKPARAAFVKAGRGVGWHGEASPEMLGHSRLSRVRISSAVTAQTRVCTSPAHSGYGTGIARVQRRSRTCLEHVLVAAEPASHRLEVTQLKAPLVDEGEDFPGFGHLERIAAHPVDQVMPGRHAPLP